MNINVFNFDSYLVFGIFNQQKHLILLKMESDAVL